MPMIDAHHHLWDRAVNSYPWLEVPSFQAHFGRTGDLPHAYTLDDYLADTSGQNVVKSVHVEAGHSPDDAVRETAWLQQLADAGGYPHGIVAYADLSLPTVQATLEGHCAFANMRGIRMSMMSPAELRNVRNPVRSGMGEAGWRAGFALLRNMDLSFDLQAPTPLMDEAAEVASAFPDTQILLTHAGLPLDRSDAGLAAWGKGLRRLAARPNIAVKISGLPMTDWNWTPASLRPIVLEVIDIFGTDRCLFGSNFPVDGLHGSFGALFDAYRRIVAGFSDAEQHALLHDNAARLYRLG